MNIFKIVLPGSDISDSRPADDVVNSLYPNPKVDTTANPPHAGIISLNWSTTGITVPYDTTRLLYSFPHNYNYVPTVFGSTAFDNGSGIRRGTTPFQYGQLGLIVLDSDRYNINLKYYSFDLSLPLTVIPPFVMQIRFYVFAERGYLD